MIVFPVIIPLLSAPLVVMLGRSSLVAWGITLVVTLSTLALSIFNLMETFELPTRYYLGGWHPPIGIEYKLDVVGGYMLSVVAFIGVVVTLFGRKSIEQSIPKNKQSLYYAVFLLCFAGLAGMITTHDVFNIYVFLEISSLATYTLIGMGKDRRALASAFEYLIIGTIGATFFLIGVGLLYMVTGSLNMSDIAVRLSSVTDYRPVYAAFSFIILGLCLKIALFPLHIWLTNAYAYAPDFASTFLSATATKVGVYLIIRFIHSLFGTELAYEHMFIGELLMILAVAAIVVGSLAAIYRQDVKRLLAFSSVAQVGYIVLGISLATQMALAGSLVHIANHAVAKACLFMSVGIMGMYAGGVKLSDLRGLGKLMPWTCAGFVVGGLSLIGVPLTAGFISKWVLLRAIVDANQQWLLVVMVISSLLAVVYIWRVIEALYFTDRPSNQKKPSEAPLSLLIPLWMLVIANIFFGVFTDWTLDLSMQAAGYLIGEV